MDEELHEYDVSYEEYEAAGDDTYSYTKRLEKQDAIGQIEKEKILALLNGLSSTQLKNHIQDIKTATKRFILENGVFEEFLLANDPTMLEGWQAFLEFQSRSGQSNILSFTSSDSSNPKSILGDEPSPSHRGPRINLNLRTDILLRSVEDMQQSLEMFFQDAKNTKDKLKAEREEIRIHHNEVLEAIALFEDEIVIKGPDRITQRIPGEKFLWYMNDWMKCAQFMIEKMRLRYSTSKSKYHKLCALEEQKKEDSADVHEVDFEKLTIENQRLLKKIEQKNQNLIELKRMTGQANCVLITHKNFLLGQLDDLQEVTMKIQETAKKTADLDDEYEKTSLQLAHEKKRLAKIKHIIRNYRAPPVMEYLKIKEDLHNLAKQLKYWKRKQNFEKMSLHTQKVLVSQKLGHTNAKHLFKMVDKHTSASKISEWVFTLPVENEDVDLSSLSEKTSQDISISVNSANDDEESLIFL